jgi:ligand-binding SRPBCC domain-containing protein
MERIIHTSAVDVPIQEVWDFHMNPQNLVRITPHGSAVRVLTTNPVIQLNAVIKVEVKVLHFVPVVMENRIIVFEPPARFVDVQEHGPFRHFRHEHSFEEVEGKTVLTDAVEFESHGLLGRMADASVIRYEFEHVLKVRHHKTAEILRKEHAGHGESAADGAADGAADSAPGSAPGSA